MTRRAADTVTMTVWLTVREGLILDEMRQMTGLDSNANLLRCALYQYAKHLNVAHLHYTDFGIRRRGPLHRPRRKVAVAQELPLEDEPGRPRQPRPKQARNRPRTDHPWRASWGKPNG